MAVNTEKVDELTLALLYLTSFEDHGAVRSWKGHDWDTMDRLHRKGFISNPASAAKSVVLSELGHEQARRLFEQNFGSLDPSDQRNRCGCGCGKAAGKNGFAPGHDQVLRTQLERRLGGIFAFRELVETVEAYVHGATGLEDLGQVARRLLWASRGAVEQGDEADEA